MRACERGMPAQIDFDRRCEPPQIKSVRSRAEKCGLRQIHFACDLLHPYVVPGLAQDTDGRRISSERYRRKGIDLRNWLRHGQTLCCELAGNSRIASWLSEPHANANANVVEIRRQLVVVRVICLPRHEQQTKLRHDRDTG